MARAARKGAWARRNHRRQAAARTDRRRQAPLRCRNHQVRQLYGPRSPAGGFLVFSLVIAPASKRFPGESRGPSFSRTSLSPLVGHAIAWEVRDDGAMGPGFRREGNGYFAQVCVPLLLLAVAVGQLDEGDPVAPDGQREAEIGRAACM